MNAAAPSRQASPMFIPGSDAKESDKCAVCLEVFSNYYNVTTCKHKFHELCIREWLCNDSANPSCPVCRFKLSDRDIIKVIVGTTETEEEIYARETIAKAQEETTYKAAALRAEAAKVRAKRAKTEAKIIAEDRERAKLIIRTKAVDEAREMAVPGTAEAAENLEYTRNLLSRYQQQNPLWVAVEEHPEWYPEYKIPLELPR